MHAHLQTSLRSQRVDYRITAVFTDVFRDFIAIQIVARTFFFELSKRVKKQQPGTSHLHGLSCNPHAHAQSTGRYGKRGETTEDHPSSSRVRSRINLPRAEADGEWGP